MGLAEPETTMVPEDVMARHRKAAVTQPSQSCAAPADLVTLRPAEVRVP
jgi:hypothetical protein